MSWIVGDSFDYYNGSADLAHSVWDSYAAGGIDSHNRFGIGQCYSPNVNNQNGLTKNIGSNEATLYVASAFYRPGALSGNSACYYVIFWDGATAQCTVCWESGGNITLKRGDNNGTVIATYAAAFGQDTWNHFQVRVVIDPTAGTFTVRKNGAIADTFTATGLNTRSSANSYANMVAVGGNNIFPFVDDLLIFSASGAAPNTWVGDCRAICLMPAADTAQKQFLPSSIQQQTFTPGGNFIGMTAPANTILWSGPVKPARNGMLQQLTVASNGTGPAHAKAALYLNDGVTGTPGTLVAVSNEVTSPASSGNIVFTFPAGSIVSMNRTYFVALLVDTAWNIVNFTNNSTVYQLARTYASGFPAPATGLTTLAGSNLGFTWQVTAGGQCIQLNEPLANGDTDYVSSTNVNDEDLYLMDGLPVTPFAILGVVSKVYIRKSDAGTRQGQLRVKSGTTEVTGVDTAVPSTWTYLARVDPVDPNTSAAWTAAAVAALQLGQKVTL